MRGAFPDVSLPVMKNLASWFAAGLGLACAAAYLFLGPDLSLAAQAALKAAPIAVMCLWLCRQGIGKGNWPMLPGLVGSMACDVALVFPGRSCQVLGMVANLAALGFYIFYLSRMSKALRPTRLVPGAVLIGLLYFVLSERLHGDWLAVLVYCGAYAVFVWRAAALEEPQDAFPGLAAPWGALLMTSSDALLSLTAFGMLPAAPKYHWAVMLLWWGGLWLLAVHAAAHREPGPERS